jgi:hypothetical protein
MLALAILEHWLLVLPLDATKLWRWALREANRRRTAAAAVAEIGPELSHAILDPITPAAVATPPAPAALSTGLR